MDNIPNPSHHLIKLNTDERFIHNDALNEIVYSLQVQLESALRELITNDLNRSIKYSLAIALKQVNYEYSID